MTKTFFIGAAAFFISVNGSKGQTLSEHTSMQRRGTIPLPNVDGRIDHIAFDSRRRTIFVAALGNNTVEVIDVNKGKVTHTIKDLTEPQGVIFIPESNSIFVANGGNGECDVFNADSFLKTASVKLSGDADNVIYDRAENKIYVGYGNGGIAIIDANTFNLLAEIKLSGHPESFQRDRSAKKMYVNVPGKHHIEVIDLGKLTVTDTWKMKGASANFPMSLDETRHRLFIGCRHPAKLLVLDTQTGETISSLDIDRDADDIFYDSSTKQIYVSCGEGYLDIIKQNDANSYSVDGKLETHRGARTSLFIPESNQLIVASPSDINAEAQLLIYERR
ncbi:MAG: YncE family protein [Bacteroidota bacterium]|nr:YncE family protein [Bacteroidota bacterium]